MCLLKMASILEIVAFGETFFNNAGVRKCTLRVLFKTR